MKTLTKQETIDRLQRGEVLFAHYHRGTSNRTSYALSGVYNRVSPRIAGDLIKQGKVVSTKAKWSLGACYKWVNLTS